MENIKTTPKNNEQETDKIIMAAIKDFEKRQAAGETEWLDFDEAMDILKKA